MKGPRPPQLTIGFATVRIVLSLPLDNWHFEEYAGGVAGPRHQQ